MGDYIANAMHVARRAKSSADGLFLAISHCDVSGVERIKFSLISFRVFAWNLDSCVHVVTSEPLWDDYGVNLWRPAW